MRNRSMASAAKIGVIRNAKWCTVYAETAAYVVAMAFAVSNGSVRCASLHADT